MADDAIAWLYGLQHAGIKLGLSGIRGLLALLGHPEGACPALLVGGTNGKGSVAATLDALLAAHGVAAGLFTSPHLVRPHERIRLRGEDIGDADLVALLRELRARIDAALASGALPAPPSFFEVTTGAALEAFRRGGVRAAVLEVGLGGRLDATNAVPAVASVVVGVDLDHEAILGSTLEAIAAEKAGIVKPGRPLVSGVAQPGPRAVLRDACARAGSPWLDALASTEAVDEGGGTWSVRTPRAAYTGLRLVLAGAHQVHNLRVALLAFETFAEGLALPVRAEAVREGVASVRWPGRLQEIPGDPPLLLDGAHNPAGAEALAAALRRRGGPAPVLLFATMRDKDVRRLLVPIAAEVAAVVVTSPGVARAADPHALAGQVAEAIPGAAVAVEPDPAAALERARSLARAQGRGVLVAGSLYLVGEVLGRLEGRPVPGPVSM